MIYITLRYVTLQTATCIVTLDKFIYGISTGKLSVSSQDSIYNRSAINMKFVFSWICFVGWLSCFLHD